MVLTVNTAFLSICCKMLLQYSVFQMRPESSISRDNNVDIESESAKTTRDFPMGISPGNFPLHHFDNCVIWPGSLALMNREPITLRNLLMRARLSRRNYRKSVLQRVFKPVFASHITIVCWTWYSQSEKLYESGNYLDLFGKTTNI